MFVYIEFMEAVQFFFCCFGAAFLSRKKLLGAIFARQKANTHKYRLRWLATHREQRHNVWYVFLRHKSPLDPPKLIKMKNDIDMKTSSCQSPCLYVRNQRERERRNEREIKEREFILLFLSGWNPMSILGCSPKWSLLCQFFDGTTF